MANCTVGLPDLGPNYRWRIKKTVIKTDRLYLQKRYRILGISFWKQRYSFFILHEFSRGYRDAVLSASKFIMRDYDADRDSCKDEIWREING